MERMIGKFFVALDWYWPKEAGGVRAWLLSYTGTFHDGVRLVHVMLLGGAVTCSWPDVP